MKKQVVRGFDSGSSSSSSSGSSTSNGRLLEESSSSSSSSSNDGDAVNVAPPKVHVARRVYVKRDYTQSTWYLRFLSSDSLRAVLREDETHRDTKEFKGMFRVSFCIFEDLVALCKREGWYNPEKRDATGNLCSNLELLVLGVLFVEFEFGSQGLVLEKPASW